MYVIVLLSYFLLKDITGYIFDKNIIINIWKYIVIILSFSIFWVIISPFAWANPVGGFITCFTQFSNFVQWDGTFVFMGELIKCDMVPWFYIFVWLGISVPVIYLIVFLIGNFSYVLNVLKAPNKFEAIIEKNNGNLSPINSYKNGFIADSPFNVEASDFLGVLGGKKNLIQ